MKITADQLNQVARLIGSNDKQFVITVALKVLMTEAGMTSAQALDAVFGPGAYQQLAEEIHSAVRAKAAA